MWALARRIMRNSKGATAVEYGLILALIVIAVIGALSSVANSTTELWNEVATVVEKS